MKEKVVLIHIGCDFPRSEEQFPTVPPLGILAVGSYLIAQGIPVELIDMQVDFGFGLTFAADRVVAQRLARYIQGQADSVAWVGISQLSNATGGVVLAEEIHAVMPEMPIVFGGYFPSYNYHFLLREYPFITAVVRGDGEAAALQICHGLANGQSFLNDQTPNLAWLSEGEIRTTPIQPMGLKNLPILDYGLLRNKACYQTGSVMTSRGCPFHCSYCTEKGMRPYAPYPVEWVARQLENMEAALQCRHAIIMDPLFGSGRERTIQLCELMSRHGFTYAAESRVDVLLPELIPHLRKAGVELIFLGIESASPSTLLRMNKVHSESQAKSYLQDALKVLKACFENGIVPELGMMLGFPGDTESDLRASLDFVKTAEELHDQVSAQTGVETGFMAYAQSTIIYNDTPLAKRLARDFQVVLGDERFAGERVVLSPSPELSDETIRRYGEEINQSARYVPKVEELINQYIYFSGENFVKTHPELSDDQGVTLFCAKGKNL